MRERERESLNIDIVAGSIESSVIKPFDCLNDKSSLNHAKYDMGAINHLKIKWAQCHADYIVGLSQNKMGGQSTQTIQMVGLILRTDCKPKSEGGHGQQEKSRIIWSI